MYLLYYLIMCKYKTINRHKFLLQYHLILVCKYRKELFYNEQISNDIKLLSQEICDKHSIMIKYMEVDKNHIHYMIEIPPTINITKVVKLIKSYTTYHIWMKYQNFLSKHFWKERTFWTDGYFISTVGNVSEKILKQYIENQG